MVVAIEGSIGVGKSTVLAELSNLGYSVQCESVDHWTLLDKFYKDPEHFAALFQIQVISSYANQDDDIQLLERSAQSARGVFTRMLEADGFITNQQAAVVDNVMKLLPFASPSLFIYLDASPELCHRRIAWRGRTAEMDTTTRYLVKLEAFYAEFLATVPHVRVTVYEKDSPMDVAMKVHAVLQSHGIHPRE